MVSLGCSRATSKLKLERPPGVRVVSAPVAFHILRDSPETMILDLRSHAEYFGPLGHINGAVNFPLDVLERRLAGIDLPSKRGILLYCGDDSCGVEGARFLREHGFETVFLIEGGIEAWASAGFGTVGQGLLRSAPDGEGEP